MKRFRPTSYSLRANRAFSLAEVAATSFLVILLAIFFFFFNDKACRDVFRAAAQQQDARKALLFAYSSANNHTTDGYFIGPVTLPKGVVYQDYGGSPPSGQTPFVSVTTAVQVTLPAPLYFFGASFTNQITFTQTYTSPIIKTKFAAP